MPDKSQDLFEIMDSALKRQREGLGARTQPQAAPASVRAQPEEGGAGGRPGSIRAVQPVEPVQPIRIIPPEPTPAAPPAHVVGPVSVRAVQPGGEEPPGASDSQPYTQKLQRMIDSPRAAPAAGSLRPNEVLRGTVFGSRRMEAEAASPPQPVQPAPYGVQTPVQSTRASVSAVLRPLAPAAAPHHPASTVGHSPSAVSNVQGSTSARRPSGSLPAARPAGTRGLYVSAEMACLAVVVVVIGWICAFFLGMRRGEKSLRSTPVRAEGSAAQTDGDAAGAPRPPVATISPSDLRPAPVGNRPGTTAGGSQQGPVSGAGAGVSPRPPSGEPQWTIELVRFASGEKAVADDRARKLSGQGLGEVWVSERKIGGRTDLSVCVGKYVSSEDAEKALRDLTALGRIKSNRLINVFQYRK